MLPNEGSATEINNNNQLLSFMILPFNQDLTTNEFTMKYQFIYMPISRDFASEKIRHKISSRYYKNTFWYFGNNTLNSRFAVSPA